MAAGRCGCGKEGCWNCYLESIEKHEVSTKGYDEKPIDSILFTIKVPRERLITTDQGVSPTQVVAKTMEAMLREIGTLSINYGFSFTIWSKPRKDKTDGKP